MPVSGEQIPKIVDNKKNRTEPMERKEAVSMLTKQFAATGAGLRSLTEAIDTTKAGAQRSGQHLAETCRERSPASGSKRSHQGPSSFNDSHAPTASGSLDASVAEHSVLPRLAESP